MIEMTKHTNITATHRQQGVGLIDVLIAVVIFSVGLLGLTALQTISKQSNYEAIQRSTAAMLAYDMMERMRMNSQSIYVGSTTISALSHYVASGTVTLQPSIDNTAIATSSCGDNDISTACEFEQLADWDLYAFQQMLYGVNETDNSDVAVGGLLNPTACISTGSASSGGPGRYTVTIAWRGQTKLENQSANDCGTGLDLYDDTTANDFAYRRILEVKSYMSCPDPGGCCPTPGACL
jgi:type IV pilus assembly protein PilV